MHLHLCTYVHVKSSSTLYQVGVIITPSSRWRAGEGEIEAQKGQLPSVSYPRGVGRDVTRTPWSVELGPGRGAGLSRLPVG